ncbi:hypothetical protein A5768_25945 [Mycolicibacterium fortuitum]|uniref:hypothetical protein n=1 Tax=Mycolicibacterium fortuitum TaxID=1766 RepID=UPI0007E992A2|nr:hypothetical protein [Mycolicibacterium fortuitum]OBG21550.1 hypothetical protein A5768_25945 [Mycolicibacterium fortuitum]
MEYGALLDHWRVLSDWLDPAGLGRPVSRAAKDLLGGVEPENPRNRRELLVLALLAVSVDAGRLQDEFASRVFLGDAQIPVENLVKQQQSLTELAISSAMPLGPLGRLVGERATVDEKQRMRLMNEPRWDWRHEQHEIWAAAVRFGHLAQTIAHALELGSRPIPFYRSMSMRGARNRNVVLINDIACVAEPWSSGSRARASYVSRGLGLGPNALPPHTLFEIWTAPAGIVAVTHLYPEEAGRDHPRNFAGESGHPIITAYPPLWRAAPEHFEGPGGLARWRPVTVAQMRNH